MTSPPADHQHHLDPVAHLRRIYDLVVQHFVEIERDYGSDARRLFNRMKHRMSLRMGPREKWKIQTISYPLPFET